MGKHKGAFPGDRWVRSRAAKLKALIKGARGSGKRQHSLSTK